MDPQTIRIDRAAPDPIYMQVVVQVRRLVASGALAAGTALPSVRAVAGAHKVNPMTVSKAYQQLVRDGVAQRRAGATLCIQSPEAADIHVRLAMIDDHLRHVAQAAADLGLHESEVLARARTLLKAPSVPIGDGRTTRDATGRGA